MRKNGELPRVFRAGLALAMLAAAFLLLSCDGDDAIVPASVGQSPSPSPSQMATAPASTETPEVPQTPAIQAAETEVIVVDLVPAAGMGLQGRCWTASLVVTRPDAWRCMAEHNISDPCLSESMASGFVVCATAPPWEGSGVRMNLTEPLPEGHGMEEIAHAWALELVDGSRCAWMGGATGGVDGERVNYSCDGDWFIVGLPTVSDIWTARKVLLPPPWEIPSHSLVPAASQDVAVAKVWR